MATTNRPPVAAYLVATILAVLAAVLVIRLFDDDEPQAAPANTIPLAPDAGAPPLVDPGADPSGTPAPEFDVVYLDGSGQISFTDLRDGRPAVVNFFGAWCAPCVRELPALQQVSEDLGDEVVVVGLAVSDPDVQDSIDILAEAGVTYPTGNDRAGDVLTEFQGLGMPTTAFVTADGIISSVHTGELNADEFAQRVDDELLS